MSNVDSLLTFIAKAKNTYKYDNITASALSGTLKTLAQVLTPEESAATAFPIDKLEEIAARLRHLSPGKWSNESMNTYKSRIRRLVNQYNAYSANIEGMPSAVLKKKAPKIPSSRGIIADPQRVSIQVPLRNNRTMQVTFPIDLTMAEADGVHIILQSIAELMSLQP